MTETGTPTREAVAHEFERAAEELDLAAHHLRTAARHFRQGEVPRGCAHAVATYGHVRNAQDRFDRWTVAHASIANPE